MIRCRCRVWLDDCDPRYWERWIELPFAPFPGLMFYGILCPPWISEVTKVFWYADLQEVVIELKVPHKDPDDTLEEYSRDVLGGEWTLETADADDWEGRP